MKKIYMQPETVFFHLKCSSIMVASELQMKGETPTQSLTNDDNVLEDSDPDSGNLGKGSNIWNAWD